MRPIIITTQRTGSTLICELLFNIAAQRFKYKNNLDEYFTITTLYNSTYQKVKGIIRLLERTKTTYDRKTATYDSDDVRLSELKEANKSTILTRIELLRNDPNYMIKLFSSDFTDEILEFVTNNYDIIYLERKDKIKQLLSFMGLVQTNVAHYTKDSLVAVNEIVYDRKWTDEFLRLDKLYQDCKQRYPGVTLYYEDFIEKGSDEDALIELLNLPVQNIKHKTILTVPTPYNTGLENLIVNKTEWASDKDRILDNLRLNSQRN